MFDDDQRLTWISLFASAIESASTVGNHGLYVMAGVVEFLAEDILPTMASDIRGMRMSIKQRIDEVEADRADQAIQLVKKRKIERERAEAEVKKLKAQAMCHKAEAEKIRRDAERLDAEARLRFALSILYSNGAEVSFNPEQLFAIVERAKACEESVEQILLQDVNIPQEEPKSDPKRLPVAQDFDADEGYTVTFTADE